MECRRGGAKGGGTIMTTEDHNNRKDVSSPNDDNNGAEEEEAAVNIFEEKGEDFVTGSTSIHWDHAATIMGAPSPLLEPHPLLLWGLLLQRDNRTAGAKNAAAYPGYHCGQSWYRCLRHGQQWRRDKCHGRRCLAAELHQH
jgi:hypothetical protein